MRWVWALTDVAGEHYLTYDCFFLPVCEQPCRRDDIRGFRTKEAAKRVRRRGCYLRVRVRVGERLNPPRRATNEGHARIPCVQAPGGLP